MAFDPTPWFVQDADHSPEVARLLAYVASQGSTGIIGPKDLKVVALAVPGSSVSVLPGAAAVLSRYPGAAQQSYCLRNPTSTDVGVTATGTGGDVVKYLVLRINDQQYAGVAAGAPYIEPVWLNVDPRVTPPAYPFLELAKLTQPENTATITQGMLEDRRRMAISSSYGRKLAVYPTANALMPTGGYASWPITSAQRPEIWVPEWATKLDITAHLSGIEFIGNSMTAAGIRSGFGADGSENGIMTERLAGRHHYSMTGTHDILDSQRGTFQKINLQAVRSSGAGNWEADYQSIITIDYQLSAVPI